MAYVRSLREIPLDEEPHASALEAILGDPEESPLPDGPDWSDPDAVAHVNMCRKCQEALNVQGAPNTGEVI